MPGYQQRGYGGPPVGGFRGGQNRYGGGDGDPDPNSEQFRKLFIGGLSFDTDESSLKQYFSKWGEIVDCIVMRDPNTKRSRGFGFIKYKDTDSVDSVQKARPHKIDDRDVETKRAMPRDDPSINNQQTVNKMFVGGLKDDTTEDMVRDAFLPFGEIKEIELINDKATGKSKGFCFVTFEDYDSVDKCVLRKRISLNSRKVEVKKAFAKGEMDPRGGRMPNMGGMGMGGMAMGRGGRGDFGYGGTGYGGGYGGGYGPSFGGGGGYGAGGWQGGYNDYGSYGPPANQGNPRFGGNSYGGNNNYGGPGGFSRR